METPEIVFDGVVDEGETFRYSDDYEEVEFEIEKVYIDEAGTVLINISEPIPVFGEQITDGQFFKMGRMGQIEHLKRKVWFVVCGWNIRGRS